MKQNPIEDILQELQFSDAEKEGFMRFLSYAKTCQESGDNQLLKSQLENIITEVIENK